MGFNLDDTDIVAKGTKFGVNFFVLSHVLPMVGQYHTGYAEVPVGHPWHGKHYNEMGHNFFGSVVEITFSDYIEETRWHIGFDQAHFDSERTVQDAVSQCEVMAELIYRSWYGKLGTPDIDEDSD